MKYKVGDEVKIKAWEAMLAEFGHRWDRPDDWVLATSGNFTSRMESDLNSDRILIIKSIEKGYYYMEDIDWRWTDDMIEGLAKEIKMPEPIGNRFEILDI